jgi:hypothetical protein
VQDLDVVDTVDWISSRITNLDSDESANIRFGSMHELVEQSDVTLLVGFGLGGYSGSDDVYGGNAIARFVVEIGLIGLVAFLMFLIAYADRPFDFLLCVAPILLAAPIVTYGFFGLWLAFRLRRSQSAGRDLLGQSAQSLFSAKGLYSTNSRVERPSGGPDGSVV